MKEVVIVSAARTAIGSFGGSLAGVSAVDLGITAAKGAIERAGIDASLIDEAVIGNVLGAGLGQNIARQVILGAGLPNTTPAFSINKVCGSGLRTVELAAQIIKAGDADIILAGGTESMSNAPYLVKGARFGVKMGNQTLIDEMITDGLWDAYNNYHMGVTAENIAEQKGITREDQDVFSVESQRRAQVAIETGRLKDEIVPVLIPQRKGDPKVFDTDEYPKFNTTIENLAKLKPAFKKDGTVTAGNASGINDGAAMFIIASKEKALELKLPIMADDLELIEANEAFAAQALAVCNELGFKREITNVNGGAIALGHPIGASGARILTTLLFEMQKRDVKCGLATLCIGGGMGTAIVVERETK